MLEVLVICNVALLFLVWRRLEARRLNSPPQPASMVEPQRVARVLRVEGTHEHTGSREFVRAYGLSPNDVLDIRLVPGEVTLESLPPQAGDCLRKLYSAGLVRGQEVTQLAAGKLSLTAAQALYIALVRVRQRGEDVFAFVAPVQPTTVRPLQGRRAGTAS